MKKIVLGSAIATLLAVPAFAADLPRGRSAVRPYIAPAPMAPIAAPAGVWTGLYAGVHGGYGFGGAAGAVTPKGWFGGAQLGYDYQIDRAVVGLAGDVSYAAIGGHAVATPSARNLWNGSVRGRLGFLPQDNLLVYGTAGFAFGQNAFADRFGNVQTIGSTGWTAGVGGEYRIDRNWSTNVEYRYTDLGSKTYGNLAGSPTYDMKNHGMRLGLNYRF